MIYKFRKLEYVIISDSMLVAYRYNELHFPNELVLNTNHKGDNILVFDNNVPIKTENSSPESMTIILENILNQEINV